MSTWVTALTATARASTFFSHLVSSPVKVCSEPTAVPKPPTFPLSRGGLLLGSSLARLAFSTSLRECQSAVVWVVGFPSLLW